MALLSETPLMRWAPHSAEIWLGAMPQTFLHEWSREALRRDNLADMGAIAHRAGLPGAWFDEALREMGDWDLLLRLTAETGQGHFWSRSRQALWRKGETSGNGLAVRDLRIDCDGDVVLYENDLPDHYP